MNNKQKTFLLLFLLITIFYCTKNDKLPHDQEHLINAYIKLSQLHARHPSDSSVVSDSSSLILSKYNLTKEEFKRAIDFYNQKPERWEKFYQEVSRRLQSKKYKNFNKKTKK